MKRGHHRGTAYSSLAGEQESKSLLMPVSIEKLTRQKVSDT